MARIAVIVCLSAQALALDAQGGNAQVAQQADAHFNGGRYLDALPLYSQLVSLEPGDHALNYRYGTCLLHGGDREKAIGHLKFAVQHPATPPVAWFWLGRAYHLNYRFDEAISAYQHYRGVADRKTLAEHPAKAMEQQCRNGRKLLSSLKDVVVHNKVETAESEFFRFYDLSDIGGRIVVLPDELKSALDRRNERRALVYLPDRPAPIYFSSLGKDGSTGLDIYRTDLLPNGRFSEPVKLAGFINTEHDEDFPFMHPDGKTFYFSSTGHNSMGGHDIFRAPYDAGMDAFGRPENLDFAINTPDDDLFYIVDADHQEACFASARTSRQGRMHVYRVSTQTAPITITILQGTYASAIDPTDRSARIVVEDALTREPVADVRTDAEGGYVLALPRSGRFRFMVDCGPTGKTHSAQVEVPANDAPTAYRQEMELVPHGDMERLMVRNHFDTPLDGDLVALAMDEIRRRAALDVRKAPDTDTGTPAAGDDIMARAGFAADMTLDQARELARGMAPEMEQKAERHERMAAQARTLAVEAVAVAEQAAEKAASTVEAAQNTDDEQAHDRRMALAAAHRQQARATTLRARAALRAAQALDAEEADARQQAAAAADLAAGLDAALAAGDDARAIGLLADLRAMIQPVPGADARVDVVERVRRAATDKERDAARALQRASAGSGEENELADRIRRKRTEREQTRNKGRREQMDKEIADLEAQAKALRQETIAAFDKARGMEKEAAVARGEGSLVAHLAAAGPAPAIPALPAMGTADLEARIAGADARVEALPIQERFDAMAEVPVEEMEARSFDWELSAPEAALRMHTRTMDTAGQGTDEAVAALPATEGTGMRPDPNSRAMGLADAAPHTAAEGDRTPLRGTPTDQLTAATAGAVPDLAAEAVPALHDTTRFFLENRIAELRQLAAVEKDRNERDRLDVELRSLETRLAELVRQEQEAAAQGAGPVEALRAEIGEVNVPLAGRVPISIGPDTPDEEIIDRLHAGYATDKAALLRLPDADERASALQGLELMLADSIRNEMALQVAVLELDPAQAATVLPRVERLRRLRAERLHMAEEHLRLRQEELLALAREPAAGTRAASAADGPAAHPALDRFVAVHTDARNVYASKLVHRSPQVQEAAAEQMAEMQRAVQLQVQVDSLERSAAGLPRKQFDRILRNADRLRDERMILLTDMGQRSAFITREEWRTASDSLKGLERSVGAKGLPPSDPLVMMVRQLTDDAGQGYAAAEKLRKQADRSEDIIARDSLYRTAYAMELNALRELDRAITVQNHLAGDAHVRGSTLTYEEVASLVLGTPSAVAMAEDPADAPASAHVPPADGPAPAVAQAPADAPADEARPAAAVPRPGPDLPQETAMSAASEPDSVAAVGQDRDALPSAVMPDPMMPAPSAAADDHAVARQEAELAVDRAVEEARLDPDILARMEKFLATENLALAPMPLDKADPDLLGQHRDRAAQDAMRAEGEALALADLADRYRDSIPTVRKRERAGLERLAIATRASSDSLLAHAAVLRAEAAQAEEDRLRAEEVREFTRRLKEFYYLDADEQRMVVDNADASRYFRVKSRAMEQQKAASEADDAARATRMLAVSLSEAAPAGGGATGAERVRHAVLMARARGLEARADSLDNVAARLRAAADLNERQAAAWLQGVQGVDPSALMALEMRTRRAEPLISEAHGQAGPEQPLRTPATDRPPVEDGGAPPREAVAGLPPVPRPQEPAATVPPAPTAADRPGEDGGAPVREAIAEVPPAPVAHEVPVVVPTAPPTTGARVPVMGVLTSDNFAMLPGPAPRSAPVPIDAPMPSGLVFKVQIGAFRKPIPMDAFSDLEPVAGERLDNGVVRYTAGLFTGIDQANIARGMVRERGYRDAFVVAYLDGRRVPLAEAIARQRGAAMAAAPAGVPPAEAAVPAPSIVIAPPAPVTPPPAAMPDSALLRAYPATAQEVVAAFEPVADRADYYTDPAAAPARQVEAVQGLFFTVQVGVYSRPVALDRIFHISPLNTERLPNGQLRYTTGMHGSVEAARQWRDQMVERGVKDAFITAYLNGRRIPMAEAGALQRRFGDAIMARP
ncbi:MAG: hypothetical protein RBT71_04805 [Flavobacteriales bacterium]|jgi:hypothetical protein|nr:hypothetical protein [Flavobacteriales bacterium]